MNGRRSVELAIMRGGTSRGPVLGLDSAPPAGPDRDALARSLIGSNPVDGLGGGTPITSKVVLVGRSAADGVDLDYIVGNLDPAGDAVDWAGTCGNMTASVVPYAHLAGLVDRDEDRTGFRLRNLATDGLIDITVGTPDLLDSPGEEVALTTSYLDPGGAVLDETLPTGKPQDVLDVDGERFDCTLIDVTHPYLLLRYEQVVGSADVDDPAIVARIERIRATMCVTLGLSANVDEARRVSPAVPRAILVHPDHEPDTDLRITAVSMGQPIRSVPVTAAMSLAAAYGMDGTLVYDEKGTPGDGIRISGPAASIRGQATVDGSGRVVSAAVDRTARCLMLGAVWVR